MWLCLYTFNPRFSGTKTEGLKNLTFAHKYDQKLNRCVGISFVKSNGGYFSIDWCFVDFQWSYDEEMERMLKESFPFREVKVEELLRYVFDKNK
jgi:hypothetical protein